MLSQRERKTRTLTHHKTATRTNYRTTTNKIRSVCSSFKRTVQLVSFSDVQISATVRRSLNDFQWPVAITCARISHSSPSSARVLPGGEFTFRFAGIDDTFPFSRRWRFLEDPPRNMHHQLSLFLHCFCSSKPNTFLTTIHFCRWLLSW